MRAPALTLTFLLALSGLSSADDTGGEVTRADLARSYQRFERFRAAAGELTPSRLAQVNRAFDRATVAFFGGKGAAALRQIDALTCALTEPHPPKRLPLSPESLRFALRAEPARWVRGAQTKVELVSLYPQSERAKGMALVLRIHGAKGEVDRWSVGAGLERYRLPHAQLARLPIGNYWVGLQGYGPEVEVGRFSVLERSLEDLRDELSLQLAGAVPAGPGRDIAHGRLSLLTDRPSAGDTAQLLIDPFAYARALRAEVHALKAGRDPYRGRPGDWWRTFDTGQSEVRARVIAPTQQKGPLPLVVALHGAGGDENMFRFGYGAGVLAKLAEERGVLVVTPRSESVLRDPSAFATILRETARLYPVDPERVYLLGHSMGSATAAQVLARHPREIAGTVLFAGTAGKSELPIRALRGALDPFGFGARGGERVPNYGHTLLVGDLLPDALDWLLARKRPAWF